MRICMGARDLIYFTATFLLLFSYFFLLLFCYLSAIFPLCFHYFFFVASFPHFFWPIFSYFYALFCYLSATFPLLYFSLKRNCGARCWRVCFQWGLPYLVSLYHLNKLLDFWNYYLNKPAAQAAGQTLPDATPPVGKIHQFSKIVVPIKPIQRFICPLWLRISEKMFCDCKHHF